MAALKVSRVSFVYIFILTGSLCRHGSVFYQNVAVRAIIIWGALARRKRYNFALKGIARDAGR
jgi:hypothetical protein